VGWLGALSLISFQNAGTSEGGEEGGAGKKEWAQEEKTVNVTKSAAYKREAPLRGGKLKRSLGEDKDGLKGNSPYMTTYRGGRRNQANRRLHRGEGKIIEAVK